MTTAVGAGARASWRDIFRLRTRTRWLTRWTPLRHTGVVAGAAIILLAVASGLSLKRPSEVLAWLQEVFGWAFALPYMGLMVLGVYAIVRLVREPSSRFARELGLQAASGVATLALTFTLLGISLGIGGLTGEALTPANVQDVIASLTGHFAMAFMTTVVGLPSAALLRAAVALVVARAPERVTGPARLPLTNSDMGGGR